MPAANQDPPSTQDEIAELKSRLAETEETLEAIRHYMVDAFVVNRANGIEIVTLNKSDIPYRTMVESMNEGAVTLIADGTIFYCNPCFGEMVQIESELLIGTPFRDLILPEQQNNFDALFTQAANTGSRGVFHLKTTTGSQVPAQLSIYQLATDGGNGTSLIATDISDRLESERQIRALAAKLSLAEQEERHRISQILHDDLQQRLFAVRAQVGLLNQPDEGPGSTSRAEIIEQFRHWLSDAIRITRNLSIDLGPKILQDERLADSLAKLCLQMKSQHGLQITLKAAAEVQNLDNNIHILLFQAVRESFFNIVKHANVSQAEINLEQVNQRVRVTVQDSGRGFDAEAIMNDPSSAHGLLLIQDRLTLAGGRLQVTSQPGHGTRVVIEVPLSLSPVYLIH